MYVRARFRRGIRAAVGLTVFATAALIANNGATAYGLDAGEAAVLNILWRVNVAGDRMTTPNASELAQPLEEAIAYVPAGSGAGRTALKRLYKPSAPSDHCDWGSACSLLSGYTNDEGTLGMPFTSMAELPGLSGTAILSGRSGADHATYSAGLPLPGYSAEATLGYGYKRFGLANTDLLSLTSGGVTIASNRVAGGALWSWMHDGVEYVDSHDYGRLIQAAMFFTDTSTNPLFGDERKANPTEAGDHYSFDLAYGKRHGSPTVVAENVSPTVQRTSAIPLEWNPQLAWFGGGPEHPVLWRDIELGKEIELNYAGLGPSVARYTTKVKTAHPITTYKPLLAPRTERIPSIEVPSVYMPPTFGNFYGYDPGAAPASRLTSLSPPYDADTSHGGLRYFPEAGNRGGVIISDSVDGATSHAMGIFGVSRYVSPGGPVAEFRVYDGRGFTSAPFVKMNALFGGDIPAGQSSYTTYLVTGSINTVTAAMDQLYARSLAGQLN